MINKSISKIGSKERFLEMFQSVNKINLNEDFNTSNNSNDIVGDVLEKIKNGEIKIKNSETQAINGETFVVLMGTDSNNDVTKLTFKVSSQEGDQDGVEQIQNVELKQFSYRSADGSQNIDMDENDLQQFNQQYGNQLFDVIQDYIDIETDTDQVPDDIVEAIDAIKVDSYPYGGTPSRMQTGKAYADQKPTNAAVRVKSPELDKYLDEDLNSIIHTPGTSGAGPLFPQAKEMGVTNQYILKSALNDIGVELINVVSIGDKYQLTLSYDGKKYNANINKQYGNAAKVVNIIKKKLGIEVNDIREDNMSSIETNTPEEVEDQISPEKEQLILTAYNNVIERSGNPNYAPTTAEVHREIDKIIGKAPAIKRNVYPSFAEPYLGGHVDPYMDEGEKSDYPDPIGSEFSVKKTYPKEKKKISKKVKIGESTDQDQYENVVFLQGDEAYQPLEILDTKGPDAALEYLKQWHNPGQHEGMPTLGHGSSDKTYEKDGYILSWNPSLEYIGLAYDLSQMNEEEITPDENPEETPEFSEEPDFDKIGMSIGTPMDGSASPDIEQLAKDHEETGEILHGGLGDGKSPLEFDADQIIMGLEVEKEHSDNPLIALEIVLDHLTENPDYYSTQDSPEDSAQFNAAGDASEEDADTDSLLGFKPHNVGDYEGGEEEKEESPEHEAGETPEEEKEEHEEEKEEDIDENQEPATWDRINTAKKTMRMPGEMGKVLGSMSKDEARKILTKRGGINVSEEIEINGSTGNNSAGSISASSNSGNNNNDEYAKYNEFKKKPYDSLDDQDKQEYFQLINKYQGK